MLRRFPCPPFPRFWIPPLLVRWMRFCDWLAPRLPPRPPPRPRAPPRCEGRLNRKLTPGAKIEKNDDFVKVTLLRSSFADFKHFGLFGEFDTWPKCVLTKETYSEFRLLVGCAAAFFFGEAGMVDANFLFAMLTAWTAFCKVALALFSLWIAIFCVMLVFAAPAPFPIFPAPVALPILPVAIFPVFLAVAFGTILRGLNPGLAAAR